MLLIFGSDILTIIGIEKINNGFGIHIVFFFFTSKSVCQGRNVLNIFFSRGFLGWGKGFIYLPCLKVQCQEISQLKLG